VSLLTPVNIPNPFTILEGGSSNESVELLELSQSAAYSGLTRKTMIW